jgi:hypothetical protein
MKEAMVYEEHTANDGINWNEMKQVQWGIITGMKSGVTGREAKRAQDGSIRHW